MGIKITGSGKKLKYLENKQEWHFDATDYIELEQD